MRLTEPSHWDGVHEGSHAPSAPAKSRFRLWLRFIGRSYASEQIWNVWLPRYLESGPRRALEIGCAPGHLLKQLHDCFGYEPYGVDYSPIGAKAARTNFEAWGFPPDHVFESDAFAGDFQRAHAGKFDVVMSCGVIEHFTELEPVMAAHLDLLTPGGTLIIMIPNYRGLHYALGLLTVRKLYPLHNLELMRIETFRKVFSRPDLALQCCGYVGGIDLGLLEGGSTTWFSEGVLKLTRKAQWLLNILFRYLFVGRLPESGYTSPYLIYVGRKIVSS